MQPRITGASAIVEPRPESLIADRSAGRIISAGALSSIVSRWWVAFAASAIFVVSGHILIKAGLIAVDPVASDVGAFSRILHVLLQPQVYGGLFIYLLGTACWMRAVSQREISFLYPLSSINYVLVTAASAVLFHEVISPRRAAGVLLIILGMFLMSKRRGERSA